MKKKITQEVALVLWSIKNIRPLSVNDTSQPAGSGFSVLTSFFGAVGACTIDTVLVSVGTAASLLVGVALGALDSIVC